MDLYREEVMDHYENPRNKGEVSSPSMEGRDTNASCGDMIQYHLKTKDGKLVQVKWMGIGCAISTAAASKLSEWLEGKKVAEVKKMNEDELVELIGFAVSPGRRKCLTLPVRVVMKTIS